MPNAKTSDHVSRLVQRTESLLDAIAALRQVTDEAVYLGYAQSLTDGDFVGENDHLTAAKYQQALSTLAALKGQLEQGGASSVYATLYGIKR